MKKITITLFFLSFAFSVFGQNAVNNTGSDLENRTLTVSHWLTYPVALNNETGDVFSLSTAPVFSDSNGYINNNNNYAYGISQTFNAYSQVFSIVNTPNGIYLPNTEGYTLDSVWLGGSYYRYYIDTSVVDTLLINLYQGVFNSIAFPAFTSDTTVVPTMYYSSAEFGPLKGYYTQNNIPITTLKVLLHQVDTAAGFAVSVTGGMTVSADDLVGMTVAFKPGFKVTPEDDIGTMGNYLVYAEFDENNLNELLDTSFDNNYSYRVSKEIQYNQSISDSLYLPTFAYGPNYQVQDNDISFHIIYDSVLAGVQTINSLVAGQTIYPNPSTDQAMLKYTLKSSASVIINVSDITGKIIGSINEGNLGAGFNQQLINTEKLADGFYMVSIIANGSTSVSKLVVAI